MHQYGLGVVDGGVAGAGPVLEDIKDVLDDDVVGKTVVNAGTIYCKACA